MRADGVNSKIPALGFVGYPIESLKTLESEVNIIANL
jgi:hypothetical protein